MKKSDLIRFLNKFNDEEELCVLLWDKSCFDYSEDDEVTLTDEGWSKVVSEFEEMEFISVGEWISDSVSEYAKLKDTQCL